MTGRRVSHYEITDTLGEGGMGVVYRARDTRLNRAVALKFLAQETGPGAERHRRFIHEAQAASALNHPNIITIYDVGSADGQDFIAMELVTGRSLQALIAPGGLRVGETLGYAIQIAGALAGARAAGIVHRDLKPANVMVTEAGQVKVLDFGLAKVTAPALAHTSDVTVSVVAPTIEGQIVGTVSYMSPEQAEGRTIDRRSDIFSFGVLLYEMTTGQRPFAGESTLSTLSSILQRDPPPVTDIAPHVPRPLSRIIARCMSKDVSARYQHMDDLRIALLDIEEDLRDRQAGQATGTGTGDWQGGQAPGTGNRNSQAGRRASGWRPIAATATACLALGAAAAWWALAPQPVSTPKPPPTLQRVTSDGGLTTQPALSPDGKLIAYASDRATGENLDIWVQQVAGGTAIRLTDDPADDHEPHFSPDGSRVVFRSDREGGGIYMAPTFGGAARLVAKGGHYPRYSPNGQSIAFWSGEPGSGILFVSGEARMLIVSAEGGTPRPLRPEFSVAFPPAWMPDGEHLIFWGRRETRGDFDWWVTPLDGGDAVPTGLSPVVGSATPGLAASVTADFTLLFSEGGLISVTGGPPRSSLWRVPLDRTTFRALAPPELVTFGTGLDNAPSVSLDGVVAFQSGAYVMDLWMLPMNVGTARVLGPPTQITRDHALDYRAHVSADGRYVAFLSDRFGNRDLFLRDLTTGTERPLSTSPQTEISTAISVDGAHVAYGIQGAGQSSVFTVPLAGGVPTQVCENCGGQLDWFPDGRALLSLRQVKGKFAVIVVRPGRGVTNTVSHSGGNLFEPHLSPDGRWLAVAVNTGQGRSRIWFAPFANDTAGAESTWIPVTEDAGFADKQRFSPDGGWLYYYSKRDGFGCVYAQRLDRATGLPSGPPVGITHFHSSRRSLANASLGPLQIAVARDKLVFNMAEITGNIWLLIPPDSGANGTGRPADTKSQ